MTIVKHIAEGWALILLIFLLIICRKGGSRRSTWRGGYGR
jgi:hypothetical protein